MSRGRRHGDPAESVLHFLSDVLSTPDPRLATRFLGVLPSEGASSGKIFTSILSKLTLTKSADANLSVYVECLHSLAEVCSHSSYTSILNALISDDPVICRDIFNAAVTSNEALRSVKDRFQTKAQFYSYKANIYTVLSKCLPYVKERSDLHRIVLQKVFKSFFSTTGEFTIFDDLSEYEGGSDEDWKELSVMYEAMAVVVKSSILDHWNLFKQFDRKAFGSVCNLAYKSLKVVVKYGSIPDCKTVSEASCSIARNIMNKLCEELALEGRLFDEMLRNLPLVEISLTIFYNVDSQMSEELRTHVFGVIHALLSFIIGLPSSSTLKPQIQQTIKSDMDRVCRILNDNLILTTESKEMHVLLFELMAFLLEFWQDGMEVVKTFLHFIQNSMPAIVIQLKRKTLIQENQIALLNAQFILLSKLATTNGSEVFAKRALELIKDSRVFDLLLQNWPPSQLSDLARVRELHPMMILALKFLSILLSQRVTCPVANGGIELIFHQHLEQFRIALIQGTKARVLDHEWVPAESDAQVAELIESVIFHSTIKSSRELYPELAQCFPSLKYGGQM